MKAKKMKTVDLFCGCGGMSLGFQNAGYDIVLAVDNWQPAIDVYKKNFKHKILNFDLKNHKKIIKVIKPLKPEIIIGGPPCQDFSIAGKRRNTKRSNLTTIFAKIVSTIKPNFFVMENVYNFEKNPLLELVTKMFKKKNYGLTKLVLNSNFYGAPQSRNRFFLVGSLKTRDNFYYEYLSTKLNQKPITLREYFKNKLDIKFYYAHPRSYKRRAIFSVDEPSVTIRGVNRPMPRNYKKHKADKEKPKFSIRNLTHIERSQIQTFPKSFKYVGSKTHIEQLIGNAVPVKLAEHIAKIINKPKNVQFNKYPRKFKNI